jgi:MFS family permease
MADSTAMNGNGHIDSEKAGSDSSGPIDAPAPVEAAPSPRNVTGLAWAVVVISILSSVFIYALDNTIVADILPTIVNDLGDVEKLPWLSVGFMIGGVAMVMPFGKLFGIYNAKWLYIICSVIFLAASALCGAAPTMNAMIVGRVFAGAGGNGMYLGVLTLLSVNTNDKERPAYLSLVGLVWGTGTILGPVVGGGFERVSWRWAFYINLIIGGIWAPIYLFLLPAFDPKAGTPLSKRAINFDYMGAVLSVAGFVCVIMAISFGGALYAWDSGQIIALFVVGIVIWIVFFFTQGFKIFTSEKDRMFPMHFFRNKEALLLFLLMGTGACAAFVPIYYIPLYFQFTQNDNALESAVRLLPFICVLSAFILLNGALMSKFGYYKPWYVVGSALGLIGSALMSRINLNTSTATIYGYEILIGIGTGAYAQASYAVIQAVIDPADMAYGITFIMIAQLGSMAFSLAICGAVFLNVTQSEIQSVLPQITDVQVQQLILGTSNRFLSSLSHDDRLTVLNILVDTLRQMFIPVYVATAIGLVASIFMRNKREFVPAAAAA